MNTQIINTNIENILFFDIETVRRNRVLDVNSKEYELYSWSIRDKTTGFVPPSKEVISHYEKMGALKPEFNKIITIGIGYIKGTKFYYKAIVGEQKQIIEDFYKILNTTGFIPCGHNINSFDIPTIRLKAFEENVDFSTIPKSVNDAGKKPWDLEKDTLDTMKILTGSYYYNISLDSACMLVGIKSSKEDISGAQVSQVYYNEGIDKIATYCNKDVIATAELFLALQGKRNFLTEYIDRDKVKLPKQQTKLLDHILATGRLSKKTTDTILKAVEDNELNKELVLKTVVAALSYTKKDNKVEEEDYLHLKELLGLTVDYSLIKVVTDKGNLAKRQANELIKNYKDSPKELKDKVVELTESFLKEKEKLNQKTAKASLQYLKDNLL